MKIDNPMHMSLKFAFYFFIAWLFLTSAIAESGKDQQVGDLSVEFSRVEFKSGRPLAGESIEESVADFRVAERDLKSIAESLKKIDKVGAEIVGFTDSRECSELKCQDLSLRRAKLIYEWLIRHGVPSLRLKGPTAGGAGWPIGDNKTKIGREVNRRVQFDLFLIKDPEAKS